MTVDKKYRRDPDANPEVLEHEDLRLDGEEEDPPPGKQRMRILTNFVIVEEDEKRMRPIYSGKERALQAIGYAVRANLDADEDAGQEDDELEEEEAHKGLLIRTTILLDIYCDYLRVARPYGCHII